MNFLTRHSRFLKRVDDLGNRYEIPKNPPLTVETDNSTKKFDFAVLKELFLTKGLDALINELKALKNAGVVDKIGVKTDDSGKTTVSVEVDGIEYEFTGVKGETPTAPPATDPKTPPADTTPTTPPSTTTQDPKNGVFDLSGVPNLNSKVGDLTKAQFFTALSAIKEQLHTYIKEQLKNNGVSYNKELVEKELNYLITLLQKVMGSSSTIQDAINKLKDAVDSDIEKSKAGQDIKGTIANQKELGQAINIAGLGFTKSHITETFDVRLMRTDDFFLSVDEVRLKQLLNPIAIQKNSSSKEDIKIYAQHMRQYIQEKYKFGDKNVDNIINIAMNSSKTIAEFVEQCKALVIRETLKMDKTIAPAAQKSAAEAKLYDLKYIVGNNASIHTEFGVDKQGNIVFQEQSTTDVYNRLKNKLIKRLQDNGVYDILGGYQTVSRLIQNAWIAAYNNYNSSQSNNAANFVMNVLGKFEAMMHKLTTNPEYLQVFIKQQSYGDTSLTDDLMHYNTKTTYGNDENIVYSGGTTVDSNGVVHLANKTDDPDYQVTMNQLLIFVRNKYSTLPAETVTKVFRNAQQQAIKALINHTCDCPYGTGNNSGRVEDTTKNWGGYNNRLRDSKTIQMDQLVQMTLYYFDKLLTAELIK